MLLRTICRGTHPAVNERYQSVWSRKEMNIGELKNGMKRVDVEARVVSKEPARVVQSRFKDESYNVATAVVADDTGSIKLTLWNEQIDQVKENDNIKVENGYVTSFKGEIQLNVGKFGKLTVQ